jgi:ribosomal protein L40E
LEHFFTIWEFVPLKKKEVIQMSDIFDKVGKTLSDTGRVVTEKAKMAGDFAKLNARIISCERSICENYSILGKFYYDTYKDNPAEDAKESVAGISDALDAIADMKAQLRAMKGYIRCPACGADSPLENDYCGKCGAFIEKPKKEEFEGEVVDDRSDVA